MPPFGGMQLLPQYKAQLDPRFLSWYRAHFNSTRMVYLHWPVECLNVDDNHYNQVVGGLDGVPHVWNNFADDPTDATYGRNTNSFAIALAGFAGAQTDDLGPNCATPPEIDAFLAQCVQILLNLRAPVANVMTHAEAADDVDQGPHPPYPAPWAPDPAPYGPLSTWERWDLYVWLDPATRQLYAPLAAHPAGTIYFPDWLRGEAALRIQQATQPYWMAPASPASSTNNTTPTVGDVHSTERSSLMAGLPNPAGPEVRDEAVKDSHVHDLVTGRAVLTSAASGLAHLFPWCLEPDMAAKGGLAL